MSAFATTTTKAKKSTPTETTRHHQQRTRSQLTLPDLFAKVPLHRSPLKVARDALRTQPINVLPLPQLPPPSMPLLDIAERKQEKRPSDATLRHKRSFLHSVDDAMARERKRLREEGDENLASGVEVAIVTARSPAAAAPTAALTPLPPVTTAILPKEPATHTQTALVFGSSTPGAPGVPRLDLTSVSSPRKGVSPTREKSRACSVPAIGTKEERLEAAASAVILPAWASPAKAETPGPEVMRLGMMRDNVPSALPGTSNLGVDYGSIRTPARMFTLPFNVDFGSPLTPLPLTPAPAKANDGISLAWNPSLMTPRLDGTNVEYASLAASTSKPPSSCGIPQQRLRTPSQPSRLPRPAAGLMLPPPLPISTGPLPNESTNSANLSSNMKSRIKTKPDARMHATKRVPGQAQSQRITRSVSRNGARVGESEGRDRKQGVSLVQAPANSAKARMSVMTSEGSTKGNVGIPDQQVTKSAGSAFKVPVPEFTFTFPAHTSQAISNSSTSSQPSAARVKPHSSPSKSQLPPAARFAFATPSTSPTKMSKPMSSPGKLVRPSSMSATSSRSTLSTLSSALDKLALPPPSRPGTARPGTSLGFNREKEAPLPLSTGSRDDMAIGHTMRSGSGARNSTPGTASRSGSSLNRIKPVVALNGQGRLTEKELRRSAASQAMARATVNSVGLGAEGAGPERRATVKGFEFGRRVVPKASKKPSLSVIAGSPIKGGGGDEAGSAEQVTSEKKVNEHESEQKEDAFWCGRIPCGTAKEEDSWLRRASRQASLASQALSRSLNAPEPLGGSHLHPESLGTTGPHQISSPLDVATRSKATASDQATGADAHVRGQAATSDGRKEAGVVKKVLEGCTIFVDVKSQDGDEAGGLFAEMCSQMGAKVIQRVGQSCTHIVFKNGLMSTITRFRLLRDPKPVVVSIAWVVDVAERRVRLDEANYKIDLDGLNVAGTNHKRRRSILPKNISIGGDITSPPATSLPDGDADSPGATLMNQSAEASTPVLLDNENLPPLEKARRRRLVNATRS